MDIAAWDQKGPQEILSGCLCSVAKEFGFFVILVRCLLKDFLFQGIKQLTQADLFQCDLQLT